MKDNERKGIPGKGTGSGAGRLLAFLSELKEDPHGWRHEQRGSDWRPELSLTGSLSNSLHLSLLIQIADLKAKHPALYFTLISTL